MKYIVEGNINFFEELYNSLDNGNDNIQIIENCCLITNEPLKDNYVKLNCGHCFNYVPLYYDLCNHKKKFNSMEASVGHLKLNEIRCPYCRHKQGGVLPYYEELGLDKVNGVNIIDQSQIYEKVNKYEKCEFIRSNPDFNPDLPETQTNKKYLNCYNYGTPICPSGPSGNYGDTKCYCFFHKKIVIKKYVLLEKEKTKKLKEEEKMKAKQLKEEFKKIKEQDKMKEKQLKEEEKMKAKQLKEELKKNKTVKKNVTTIEYLNLEIDEQNHVIETVVGCNAILKTGSTKGEPCNQPIFQEHMCKRHYNLHKKTLIVIQVK